MKTPRIIDVLGKLDDSLINEAISPAPKAVSLKEKRGRRARGFAVAAAAALLSLCLITGSLYFGGEGTMTDPVGGESSDFGTGGSEVITETGVVDIVIVSRYPGDMSVIVYGTPDKGPSTELAPPLEDVEAPEVMQWNGINVTFPLYCWLNRYDDAAAPYGLKVVLDDKIESDPEYAAQAEKLRAEYYAAEDELEAMEVMLDRINEVLDKMQTRVSAESYAVAVEKAFGRHVAEEFIKGDGFDRDAFMAKYADEIDRLYESEIIDYDNKYAYATIVLSTPEEFENPADSEKFNDAFVALYGEKLYASYMTAGFFDFYSFCFSKEGLELRTYLDEKTGMREYLSVLRREIDDIDDIREELKAAAGKYYADGNVDFDLYERDHGEIYSRFRQAEQASEALWARYKIIEIKSTVERLRGIDAEVVTTPDEVYIYVAPDKLSELEAFDDLTFTVADRISSLSGGYYDWNGIAVEIDLFAYLMRNPIDSGNRYAVGVSLSERLHASEEWRTLQKEYDRLLIENADYERLYDYLKLLDENNYGKESIVEKLCGSLGEFGARAAERYYSGDEFDYDTFKLDSAEAYSRLSEVKMAMDECADRLGKELIKETYSVFSDQVEYISVSESYDLIIIYVTAEELASLKGVEGYRFSLVPVTDPENTGEHDTSLSHDSRFPVSPGDSTAQTAAPSPDSKTPAE